MLKGPRVDANPVRAGRNGDDEAGDATNYSTSHGREQDESLVTANGSVVQVRRANDGSQRGTAQQANETVPCESAALLPTGNLQTHNIKSVHVYGVVSLRPDDQ
jgi:hypothetical protein